MSTESAAPIRVLLVDDEDMVRSGLTMLVNAESDLVVVGEARDGGEALRLHRELARTWW